MFNKFTVAILSVFSLITLVIKPLDRTPLEEVGTTTILLKTLTR